MSTAFQTQTKALAGQSFTPTNGALLQRKCACGGTPGPDGECEECRRKRLAGSGPPLIQTKLTINEPGDRYEREADRVAEEVMRMPEPGIQRQTELGGAEEEPIQTEPIANLITPVIQRQAVHHEIDNEEILQAKQTGGQTAEASPGLQAGIQSLRGGGRPLPESTRSFFERRFGYDFSRVRIHAGRQAEALAKQANAKAFTLGNDIVFAAGQYSPRTSSGQRLLGHELTHVVQQKRDRGQTEWTGHLGDRRILTAPAAILKPPVQVQPATSSVIQRQLHLETQYAKEPPLIKEETFPGEFERDARQASDYVDRFYYTHMNLHAALVRAAHRAVYKFDKLSGIPRDTTGESVFFEVLKFVLSVVPGGGPMLKAVDRISKGLDLAVNTQRLATIIGQAGVRSAGIYQATQGRGDVGQRRVVVGFIDNLADFDREGTARIDGESKGIRAMLDRLETFEERYHWRGRLRRLVEDILGKPPSIQERALRTFELEYELGLYKQYYGSSAYLEKTVKEGEFYDVNYPYGWRIRGIPNEVQNRIASLIAERGYSGGREYLVLYLMKEWQIKTLVIEKPKRPKLRRGLKYLFD